MQHNPPSQRPLTWWRRGLVWVMLVGSVAGLVLSMYAASYITVAILGTMLSMVLFLISGVLSYVAIFPKKLAEQFKDFSFTASTIGFAVFGIGVLVISLTLWWGAAVA